MWGEVEGRHTIKSQTSYKRNSTKVFIIVLHEVRIRHSLQYNTNTKERIFG